MAVDGLKRALPQLPKRAKQPAPRVAKRGGADRRSRPARSQKVAAAKVERDGFSRGTSQIKTILKHEMARLGGPVAVKLVGPPAGATVASPGAASLIGLKDDYFDPKGSYEANLSRLKAQGIPRFPLLSAAERAHETAFADAVQKDPAHFVAGAEILASAESLPTYEVDAEKRQYGPYGTTKLPDSDRERSLRLEANHALHPTAVAIAQLAFLKKLDALQKLPDGDPKKQVFVTSGGCAAGKGSLGELMKRLHRDMPFGAVWDSAGEGDARENAWVLEACSARGIKATFGYAAADPATRYYDVLRRSEDTGRVVDLLTFTSSYVAGAKNMKAFIESDAFKAAAAKGAAASVVVYVGDLDRSTMTYPHARLLGDDDIPPMPAFDEVLRNAVGVLDTFAAERKSQGKSTEALVRGALLADEKFL